MPEIVDRLVACGVNVVDAWEIVEDYLYDEDREGLAAYVDAVESEYRRNVAAI